MAVRQKVRFVYQRDPAPSEKLAPQAAQILKIVKERGEEGILKSDLIDEMVKCVVTRQQHDRILAFYQKDMESAGLLKIEKLGPTEEEIAEANRVRESRNADRIKEREEKRSTRRSAAQGDRKTPEAISAAEQTVTI